MGPRSSSAVTGHGDAHADPHPSKHSAASVMKADAAIQSDENVEAEADEGHDVSLPNTQEENAIANTTVSTFADWRSRSPFCFHKI